MQEQNDDNYILTAPKRVSVLMIILIVVMGIFLAVLGADYVESIKTFSDALPWIFMAGTLVLLIYGCFMTYGEFKVRFDFVNHKIIFQNRGKKTILDKDDIENWKLYKKTIVNIFSAHRGPITLFIFEANLKNGKNFTFQLFEEHANNQVVELFKKALQFEPTSVRLDDQFSSEKDQEIARKIGKGKSSASPLLIWFGLGGMILILGILYSSFFSYLIKSIFTGK